MRQVRCPSCDRSLTLPSNVRSRLIRCPSCKEKIDLDTAEVEVIKGGSEALAPSSVDKPDISPDKRPRNRKRKPIHGLMFLLIIVPLGLFLLICAPFSRTMARLAIGLGGSTFLPAAIMAARQFEKTNLWSSMSTIPWLIRGPAVFFYFQFRYAIEFPRLLACWFGLEVFALGLGISAQIIDERHARAQRDPLAKNMAPNPLDPNPNAGADKPAGAHDDDANRPVIARDRTELEKLFAELDNNNEAVRNLALSRLSAQKPNANQAAIAQKLTAMLETTGGFTWKAVVRALTVWATPEEIPALIRILNDGDTVTRLDILRVIGKFRDEGAVAPVVQCLQDPICRFEAERALRQMGTIAEKNVLHLLSNPDPIVRRTVVGILKDIGTNESVPALQAIVGGNDRLLRIPAQQALAAITARNQR